MTEYTDPKTINKDAMLSKFYAGLKGKAQSGAAWSGMPMMSALGMKAGKAASRALSGMGKKKKKKKKNGPY